MRVDMVVRESRPEGQGQRTGDLRWTPDMRQVAMRESCFYKRPRNRSSHEAVTAEAQRDV
jgi:hypothetical protein